MEKDSSRWRRPWTTTSWYDQHQPDGQGLIYINNYSSTTCQLLHTSQLNMYNIVQQDYFWKPVSYLWTTQELTLSQELEYQRDNQNSWRPCIREDCDQCTQGWTLTLAITAHHEDGKMGSLVNNILTLSAEPVYGVESGLYEATMCDIRETQVTLNVRSTDWRQEDKSNPQHVHTDYYHWRHFDIFNI